MLLWLAFLSRRARPTWRPAARGRRGAPSYQVRCAPSTSLLRAAPPTPFPCATEPRKILSAAEEMRNEPARLPDERRCL